MKQFFYKSQQTAVGAVLLTVLMLLVMPESARARLKSAIGGLFLPLIGISTTGQVALESIGKLGTANSGLSPTNQAPASLFKLQNEVERLRSANKDLSELLALEPLIPWETKLVRVVGRD